MVVFDFNRKKSIGDRLMVGQQVLVLLIGVRLPIPEHNEAARMGCFIVLGDVPAEPAAGR